MSKTTKKKYVHQEVLYDFFLPEEKQEVVRVEKSCGNNLHSVTTAQGDTFLASMPRKFRNTVWIKKGNFVITEPIPEGNKVKAEIVRILRKEQIRYIQQEGKWPKEFCEEERRNEDITGVKSHTDDSGESEDDSDLCPNPNHNGPPVSLKESSSDSEEGSSEYEDCEESHDKSR